MAKLICNDGTEVNISNETEQELRKSFEKKSIPVVQLADYDECNDGGRALVTFSKESVQYLMGNISKWMGDDPYITIAISNSGFVWGCETKSHKKNYYMNRKPVFGQIKGV